MFGLDKGSNAAGERFEIVVKEPQIETIRVALEMIHGNTVTGFEEEEVARYEVGSCGWPATSRRSRCRRLRRGRSVRGGHN